MNPTYLRNALERIEQGIFDLIGEVKKRYDFTPISEDEAMNLLFDIQSNITLAKQLTDELIEVLSDMEMEYEALHILEAEPITEREHGFVKWR